MLHVTPVPAFNDNYIWLIHAPNSNRVAIVDPGDAQPVLRTLRENELEPCAILITHHHGDHVGGIGDLLSQYPGLPVYGPSRERIPHLTRALRGGDSITPDGLGLRFDVLDVPGHTGGHIAYYGAGALFCGDTLFACGCGRVFDGTIAQLHASLGRIAALPADTRIYCAHEYTLDNIGFAKWVEPENPQLLTREQADFDTRERGEPTVPSTLELELETNPFLRAGEPTVIAAAERFAGHALADSEAVFAAIRRWKDTEYD
ncbi:MAG: hydroxyacylglutathione hydrolase [Gammaproteobacteria bacterium]|jgi:hydroxyacylglutathione hydrolase